VIAVEVDAARLDGWVGALLRENLDLEAVIFNLVPYVKYLEYGTSRMAPAGMVRVSLREIAAHLGLNVAGVAAGEAIKQGTFRTRMAAALDDAAEAGRLLIRSRTPIDTGRARRGWAVIRAEDRGGEVVAREAERQVAEAAAQARLRALAAPFPVRRRGGFFTRGTPGPPGG